METVQHVYGPVPSRRLGLSLGISPIPKKTCNYSCVYCQLGRTDRLTNDRQWFYRVADIVAEFEAAMRASGRIDAITVVGEGEPTLFAGLGELITELRARTDRPVAVITNGALLCDPQVRHELANADIVLPSMDAWDEASFRQINRPHRRLHWPEIHEGLRNFSREYAGELWLEIMLMKGVNDDDESLRRYADLLRDLRYDRLYLNTPVRPPAEPEVEAVDHETMARAAEALGGTSIDLLASVGFRSRVADDHEALLGIIKRHPMNQFEIESFLVGRGNTDPAAALERLARDPEVAVVHYRGIDTYRLRPHPGSHGHSSAR
ncbi:MAG: radical SAM protein [Actinomycetota bacterium]